MESREQNDGVERRADAALAQRVNFGLKVYLSEGPQAAESYLRGQQVPGHVVLRVLACAAFRRRLPVGVSVTDTASR